MSDNIIPFPLRSKLSDADHDDMRALAQDVADLQHRIMAFSDTGPPLEWSLRMLVTRMAMAMMELYEDIEAGKSRVQPPPGPRPGWSTTGPPS